MTKLRKCLPYNVIEMIAHILGDTSDGLTGTEIGLFLSQSQIEDLDANNTKWKRLFNAFAENQNKLQYSNRILKFIAFALSPSRYINQQDRYNKMLIGVNQQLAFVGYELKKDGQYREIDVAKTIEDVQIRVDNLKLKLDIRGAHKEIFKYCKTELLQNNYFHAVLEANKGLFQRIRYLSDIKTDGINLICEGTNLAISSQPSTVSWSVSAKTSIFASKIACARAFIESLPSELLLCIWWLYCIIW